LNEAPASPPAVRTRVGSYFVANYPPFSFWRPDLVGEARAALDRPGDPAVPLGLYLHIPFCRLRCKFCYFRVYTEKNAREVEEYVGALAREVELYRDLPAVRGRPLRFVYFGGGTPSFLSTGQLRELTSRLCAALPWDGVEEVTFECEPGTLTHKKLEAIREIGTTRLSLGVENFDDRILEENGRAHRSAEIYRAYGEARQLGFPQINLDLIAGMMGETDANWKECVRRAADLAPDSITIYQMELPYNTEFSRDLLASGGAGEGATSFADWTRKRAWVEEAYRTLERAGYRVASGYTLVREAGGGASPPRSTRGDGRGDGDSRGGSGAGFVYRDALWRGADLIGAGVASFSYLSGVHFQNLDRIEEYQAGVASGALPLARALAASPEERLIREMVLQLKLGEIDAGYFRRKFGVEILSRFGPAFEGLRRRGMLDYQGDRIALTRDGLLQVDALLHEFFLPQHRGARYT
jgi:oxygen-independent coproporphyrinogen-3 oxidase